jgi:hypothetical protein
MNDIYEFGSFPLAVKVYRFGPFTVDVAIWELQEDGKRVKLSKTDLKLLVFLIEKRETAVSREEILARLAEIRGRDLEDATLTKHLQSIRKALHESDNTYIRAWQGLIRFVYPTVQEGQATAPPAMPDPNSTSAGPRVSPRVSKPYSTETLRRVPLKGPGEDTWANRRAVLAYI